MESKHMSASDERLDCTSVGFFCGTDKQTLLFPLCGLENVELSWADLILFHSR